MAWRYHGTARVAPVDALFPKAWGYCDRCGFVCQYDKLQFQFEWNATRLYNTRILVCWRCLDKPFEHFRAVLLPPDPPPIINPRPGDVQAQMAGGSPLGYDPANPFTPSPSPSPSTPAGQLNFSPSVPGNPLIVEVD